MNGIEKKLFYNHVAYAPIDAYNVFNNTLHVYERQNELNRLKII
jgi:hypothetical protein